MCIKHSIFYASEDHKYFGVEFPSSYLSAFGLSLNDYKKTHIMDYMLFVKVIESIFQQNSYNILTKLYSLLEIIILR